MHHRHKAAPVGAAVRAAPFPLPGLQQPSGIHRNKKATTEMETRMGSLFSGPSAPPPPPTPAIEVPDPDAEARRARLEGIKRRRRGRAGLIRTSPRGLLGQSPPGTTDARKTTLGG